MFGKLFHKEEGLNVQGSIIIASIIIAISIFLAANKISGGSFIKFSGNNNPQNVAAAGKINIEERKDAPTKGSGEVTIVEFSDFQCPFCQDFFNKAYKEIKAKYIDTNKVKFVYRNYPLTSLHPDAQKAAEAAECANRQGRFFDYHDMLFTRMIPISQANPKGAGLDVASLKRYAVELGLDSSKFNTCLDNGESKEIVAKDVEVATKAGVTGTPTFFINGVKVVGSLPFSNFEQIIEQELK